MRSELIFVAGLGSTGSSAVCDFLAESPNTYVPKEEWRIWVDPGCLIALARELEGSSSLFTRTEALTRFQTTVARITGRSWGRYSMLRLAPRVSRCLDHIAKETVRTVVDETYPGLWYGNSNILTSKLNFVLRRWFWKNARINYPMHLCNLCDRIGDPFRTFGRIVEHSLDDLAQEQKADRLALNENFSILFAPEIFRMHPESKIVLTIRNPLDVYSDSKRVGWLAMPYDIDQFVKWQNDMYVRAMGLCDRFPEQILVQSFEDLVEDYDASRDRILGFLQMDPQAHEVRTIFRPEVSHKNIGQWRVSDPWLEPHISKFEQLQERVGQ